MRIVVTVQPEEHQLFGADAFNSALGVSVPFQAPGVGNVRARLVDFEIADPGRSAKLVFDVPDQVAAALGPTAQLYSLAWAYPEGVAVTAIPATPPPHTTKARDGVPGPHLSGQTPPAQYCE